MRVDERATSALSSALCQSQYAGMDVAQVAGQVNIRLEHCARALRLGMALLHFHEFGFHKAAVSRCRLKRRSICSATTWLPQIKRASRKAAAKMPSAALAHNSSMLPTSLPAPAAYPTGFAIKGFAPARSSSSGSRHNGQPNRNKDTFHRARNCRRWPRGTGGRHRIFPATAHPVRFQMALP